jgi:hypothetical protein
MPRSVRPEDLPLRIVAKIEPEPNSGCWLWTGATGNPGGYGNVGFQGSTRGAHRVVYELLVGPVPDGLVLDHLCRNRPCVNPDHLRPVTQLENVHAPGSLSPSALRAKITHCPAGHEYNEANTRRSKRNERFCRACGRAAARRSKEKKRAALRSA